MTDLLLAAGGGGDWSSAPGRFWNLLPTGAKIAAVLIGISTLVAAFAPILAPFSPTAIFTGDPFEEPSAAHWLGTDTLGRDVLSRLIFGSRTVLLMASSASALAAILGGFLGLLLGFRGGLLDELAMRGLEIVMSIPPIIFALLIVGLLGGAPWLVVLTVGLLYVPNVIRVVRAATQTLVAEDFVAAARARGESSLSIALRELLPHVRGTILVEFSIRTGYAILFIGGLGFLGFGVRPPTPDWGLMINEGRGTIDAALWPVLAPAACMAVLVTSVNLFTDGIIRILGPLDQGGGR